MGFNVDPAVVGDHKGDALLRHLEATGKIPSSKLFRRMVCNTYLSTGGCPFSDRCVFLHDPRLRIPGINLRAIKGGKGAKSLPPARETKVLYNHRAVYTALWNLTNACCPNKGRLLLAGLDERRPPGTRRAGAAKSQRGVHHPTVFRKESGWPRQVRCRYADLKKGVVLHFPLPQGRDVIALEPPQPRRVLPVAPPH